jgi:hypothetical protein
MSQQQRLIIRIGADGAVTAQTVGIMGAGCLDYVAVLEHLLDATATNSQYTKDYSRADAPQSEQEVVIDDLEQC